MELRPRYQTKKSLNKETNQPEEPLVSVKQQPVSVESFKAKSNSNGDEKAAQPYENILKERGAAESKLKKFCVRFWTTWSMIGGFLGLIYLGHAAVLCLVILIQTRIYYELGNVRFDVN